MRPRATAKPLVLLVAIAAAGPASAAAGPVPVLPAKHATATGRGGAAASVDPLATAAAIGVLRSGGTAVDAAIAAAATLGVTEPYSSGIGGGGFMLVYDAARRRIVAIDGREAAPRSFAPTSFLDPATGQPLAFADAVTSGLSVGVPGTPATWATALRLYGTRSLASLLRPAIATARDGFVIDQTFHDQTAANAARFAHFSATRALYLDAAGQARPVGAVQRNPDLAATYRRIGRFGVGTIYGGRTGKALVAAAQRPPVVPGDPYVARPGLIRTSDLTGYRAILRTPTRSTYRGSTIYGMAPPSSGGTTVGEALNILEGLPMSGDRTTALYDYLEASRIAFADRGGWVGDPAQVGVPVGGLLSKEFARARRTLIGATAARSAVLPADPWPFQSATARPVPGAEVDREGPSTTHLTVADARGNIVSYTFTIEQTGGSGIVVPGYGFLLNNELTDFNFMPGTANSPEAGKRPRSSMAPTFVFRNGRPWEALGSPGGATIITTVLQGLIDQVDFGMTLPQAIAAPRASQRNSASGTDVEAAFISSPEAAALLALGERWNPPAEIGAATGIRFLGRGLMTAAAEPVRRGGGDAEVVRRIRR